MSASPITVSRGSMIIRASPCYNAYLWLVALLLPIDWFGPTGAVLREFGAKPASLVLTLGGLYGLVSCSSPARTGARLEYYSFLLCFGMLTFGVIAFCINQLANWTPDGYTRSPLVQFVNQTLLLITAMLAVLGNARLASRHDAYNHLQRILPVAAGFHLAIFALQALSIIDHFSPLLLLFRNDGGIIERPTGLMSEPSYYGVCAALYGAVLLTLPARGVRRAIYALLAIALYVTAISINAKTIVMVAGAQIILAILFPSCGRISIGKALLLLTAVGFAALSFITRFSALDVSENLSSAMRFGSTLLSLNVSLNGFAWPGIGIGQFHFFYREAFAPDFLFLSQEGLDQLSLDAPNRASTFNFFTRALLELGVAGVTLFFVAVTSLLRTKLPRDMIYIATMLTGSLGFMMTQDTYFYPPLVLSCALLLGIRYAASKAASTASPFHL